MSVNDTDANHVIGTIQDMANALYDELLTSGYSLLVEDVIKVVIASTKEYAGWSGELQRCPASDKSCDKPLLVIDANTVLGVDDWMIIKPVVRAHCDLVQARRLEGSISLGVQPIGMSSSEARQLYDEAVAVMKKEAFQFQPFSIEVSKDDTRYPNTSLWF